MTKHAKWWRPKARLIPYAFLVRYTFSRLRRVDGASHSANSTGRCRRRWGLAFRVRPGKSRFDHIYPICKFKVHNFPHASSSLTPFGRPGTGSFELIATVHAEGLWLEKPVGIVARIRRIISRCLNWFGAATY
jgi:hypothetical protein